MFKSVAAAAMALLFSATLAKAEIVASVSLARQVMTVYVDGELAYSWPVSTARKGYVTPRGKFRAQWLDEMHLSSIYENAPMPHSVFFSGGFAIHGSYETRFLGHPASHGCVRLSPEDAATFYGLVEEQGLAATRILIH